MPILSILLIIGGLLGVPAPLFAQDSAPLLEVPVPGIELSPILRGSDFITVPWLAQYIGGAYTFLISIAGLLAAVMMAVGGFQYLTSAGDSGKIGAAKTRMTNALIGLLLAFGSYTVLYAINPDLVSFNGLQIAVVKTDVWQAGIDNHMGTTTADTALGEDVSVTQGAPATATAGDYKYSITTCPWTWETTKRDDRKEEFIRKYQQYLTKTEPWEKVLQIGEMADVCDVILGSCGTTVGSIIAMAYRNTPNYATMSLKSSAANNDCLDRSLAAGPHADSAFNCNGFRMREIRKVSSELRKEQYGRRCDLDGFASVQTNWDKLIKTKAFDPATGRVKVDGLGKCNLTNCLVNGITVPIEGCAASSNAARLQFLEKMQAAGKAGQKELVGYPDSWTNELRPGDYINIYNGNTDLTGGHAQLFLGWGKDKKHAHVIQGGGGCGKDGVTGKKDCGVTRYGYPCYTSGCGAYFMPITSIYRPY
ncbi:MAG TPA: pilin [Candidatus Baltobacteraceae bacterium]|nr:pilin [Candidatus Baltobacteraceae bacterium]